MYTFVNGKSRITCELIKYVMAKVRTCNTFHLISLLYVVYHMENKINVNNKFKYIQHMRSHYKQYTNMV